TKKITPLSLKVTKKDCFTGDLYKGPEFVIYVGDLSGTTSLETMGDGIYELPPNTTLTKEKV
ncbi:hypothetical protein, partial [Enterococcus faecalis]|uniref:hypothetical protein n=1 Tax=Enterococcus faecalis TaxID=1351 RepID=UPI003CC5DB85